MKGKKEAQGGNPWLHSPPPGRLPGWRTPALCGAGGCTAGDNATWPGRAVREVSTMMGTF